MLRLIGTATVVTGVVALALATPTHAGVFGPSPSGTPPTLAKKLHKPVSARLMTTLEKASKAGLHLQATPPDPYLKMISGPQLKTGNKTGLLYIGADFCPFCAGQRWGLVLTLLRFGEFSGLRYMLSSPTDVHPNTATFTFTHANYRSRHVALQAVEVESRNHEPLMTLDKFQKNILTQFDAPPYTRFRGGIPFVYLDGHYMLNRPIVKPGQLTGQDWKQIAHTLADPQSLLFHSVMPRVNLLTAAICRLDGNQPVDVCTAPGVVAANGALRKLKPMGH